MKKFSKLTNQKIGQVPVKKEPKVNEEESFKYQLMGLIDQYLHIQTYGPIDRYLRAGTIKITGKEELAGALVELMSDKSTNEKTILLENLKSKVKDWEAIDETIEEVGAKRINDINKRKLIPHIAKVTELLEKYGEDEETLIEMVNKSAERIKTYETALLRSNAAGVLGNQKISEIYAQRANELV